jgi:hypothetical protein
VNQDQEWRIAINGLSLARLKSSRNECCYSILLKQFKITRSTNMKKKLDFHHRYRSI